MTKSLDFDFEAFAVDMIQTIDSISSFPKGVKNAKPIESRINAFYRAVGLPAVVDPANQQDGYNVGNVCDDGTMTWGAYSLALGLREAAWKALVGTKDGVLLHYQDGSLLDNLKVRPSGNMLPILVNGSLEIYPQTKRVVTPFAEDRQVFNGTKSDNYRRPLIESIINMRVKSLGTFDSNIQGPLLTQFNKAFPSAKISVDVNGLNAEIAIILREALISAVDSMSDAIQTAHKSTLKSGTTYQLPPSSIAEQNPQESETQLAPAALDKQAIRQQAKQATRAGFLSLLEFEDDSGSSKQSAKDSLLFSSVVNAITTDDLKSKQDESDLEQKQDKADSNIKGAMKTMDLFTGAAASISGVDMLIVVIALFEIDIKYLLGLLNAQAAKGFADKSRAAEVMVLNGATKISDALFNLEYKVTELYEFVDISLKQVNRSKSAKKNKVKAST
jgi:hypothetical protein